MKIKKPAVLAALALFLASGLALAFSLDDLSNQDASEGLKAALNRGAGSAVDKLGVTNGFLNNPKVKIPLPPELAKAESTLRMFGMGKQADALVDNMNHAAEAAVPQARDLLIQAVKGMTVTDAKNILMGGDESVTDFFRAKTRDPLAQKFLPVVKQTTDQLDVAQKYDQIAAVGARFGLIKGDSVSIEQYVTQKTLDGLYTMIGEEEKAIRSDPVGTGSAILAKVFGALKQ